MPKTILREKWYTAEELTEQLGLNLQTVQKKLREGNIKATKIGRRWHVSESELKNYMNRSY